MKILLTFSLFFAMTVSADAQKAFQEIEASMAKQTIYWNEGDLEGFMEFYWQSDDLRFVSKKGVTKGWDQTLANYQKSYPDKAAMGTLNFNIISHEFLSKKAVLTVGEWVLTYPDGKKVGGHFTLLWKKIDKSWKIVLDHTS